MLRECEHLPSLPRCDSEERESLFVKILINWIHFDLVEISLRKSSLLPFTKSIYAALEERHVEIN
jgi:hypothetical protein